MGGLSGVAVIAHGGGPTAVVNASLAGVIEESRRHPEITALYGARHGISGIIGNSFLDLSRYPASLVDAVANVPASALGSCRCTVTDDDIDRALHNFEALDVRYCFYNGGNGSMNTAWRLERGARERGFDLRVIGIPKTIDNDLARTDHSPGFGSAARFFAYAARDLGEENRSLPPPVTVLEVLGRNAGWLVAATALARHREDDAPHLIYCPERRLTAAKLLADVEAVYRRLGRCLVAVCEGQLDDRGEAFGADPVSVDAYGRPLSGNLGHVLARLITRELKIRARSEKPGLLGRSCEAFVSAVDREEARLCGRAAVEAAIRCETGKMITLERLPGPGYRVRTGLADLESVWTSEQLLPPEWISACGSGVTAAIHEYAAPLAGEISPHPRLD